jgi:hypothetical protein
MPCCYPHNKLYKNARVFGCFLIHFTAFKAPSQLVIVQKSALMQLARLPGFGE